MAELLPNEQQDARPSDFVKLGQPMCSRWGKSEVEWIALAYVQALANDGDTWKRLTREQTYALLTDEQKRLTHGILTDDFEPYERWFDAVSNQITDAEGALGVRGFWNEHRLNATRNIPSNLRVAAQAILDRAQPANYAADYVMVHRRLIGRLRVALQSQVETERKPTRDTLESAGLALAGFINQRLALDLSHNRDEADAIAHACKVFGVFPVHRSAQKARAEPELRHDSPEIQFSDVFAELDKGHPVNTQDAINALWWKVRNQRRELSRLNERLQKWAAACTGRHGSQMPCLPEKTGAES